VSVGFGPTVLSCMIWTFVERKPNFIRKKFLKVFETHLLIDCSQSLNCAFPSGVIWNAFLADKIVLENSS
jgi:hypothetical protein